MALVDVESHADRNRAILQKYVPRFVWFIFNITFISTIQSVLLFAFSGVPAYGILLATKFDPALKTSDFVYSGIMVALIVSEYISDGQQWSKWFCLFSILDSSTHSASQTIRLPNTSTATTAKCAAGSRKRTSIAAFAHLACGHSVVIPISLLSR